MSTNTTTAAAAAAEDRKVSHSESLSMPALLLTLLATNGWFFAQAIHYA